jgi:hypothetical protein
MTRPARTYPGPKFSNPRDAARFNAWRTAQRERVGLAPIATCTCGCAFPASACPGLNASNISE